MINIKNFDSNLLKIDKKSYKNTDIFYIWQSKILVIMKIFIVQILCIWLLVKQMDTLKRKKEINTEFASKDKSKEELEKYTEHWDEIKCLIKTINSGEAGDYEQECMKIKSNSHDN